MEKVAEVTHLMEEVERYGGNCCVGGLLVTTTQLLLPVGPPRGRRRWGRLAVPGRPSCSRGTSHFCRGVSTAGFVAWVGGFLTAADVVSKCLLVARKLESERGVPSEPPRADPISLRSSESCHIGCQDDLPSSE